jgi:nucleolar protein 15
VRFVHNFFSEIDLIVDRHKKKKKKKKNRSDMSKNNEKNLIPLNSSDSDAFDDIDDGGAAYDPLRLQEEMFASDSESESESDLEESISRRAPGSLLLVNRNKNNKRAKVDDDDDGDDQVSLYSSSDDDDDDDKLELDEEADEVASHGGDPNWRLGVIYLGRVPHGFYENEMRKFFAQYGDVKHVRLSRSKKTGRSRGYAFIQFEVADVAEIVAKAMHKYLLSGRILQCFVVEPDKVHPELFKNADRKPRHVDPALRHRDRLNAVRTDEKYEARVRKLVASDARKKKRLAAMGIEYTWTNYSDRWQQLQDDAAKADKKQKENKKNSKSAPSSSKKRSPKTAKFSTPQPSDRQSASSKKLRGQQRYSTPQLESRKRSEQQKKRRRQK